LLAQGEKIDEIDLELKFGQHEKVSLLEHTVGQDLGVILRDRIRYKHIHQCFTAEVAAVWRGNRLGRRWHQNNRPGLHSFDKYTDIKDRVERALNRISGRPQITETKEKYLPSV